MRSMLEGLVPWGLEIIKMVQSWETPWLTAFFRAFTMIGDKEGYLLMFPLVYWSVHAGWGRRMAMLGLASFSINTILKSWVQMPRPSGTSVKALLKAGGTSFPSGHAQGTATLWGYLVAQWKSWPVRIAVIAMVVLVGLSRIYLGVHYPQDILGSWLLALISVLLFLWLEPKVTPYLQRMPIWGQVVLALAVPLVFWLLEPTSKTSLIICSTWAGFNLGLIGDVRWLHYSAQGSWSQRFLRSLGLIVVVGVWFGLKKILPTGAWWQFLRYGMVGFCISFLVPYLLLRTGWAAQDSSAPAKA